MPKHRSLRLVPVFCAGLAGIFLTTLLVPNPLTDRVLSRELSRLVGQPIHLQGVRIRFIFLGAEISIKRTVFETTFLAQASFLDQFFKDLSQTGELALEDSHWMLMPKRGGWSVKLLNSRIGEAFIRGGLYIKGGKAQKFLVRINVRADSTESFSRLVDKRFPKSRDGSRTAKITSSGGRWVLWGLSGPVLEARWQ